ncbi:MAG TPA: penicillin-binding protein 2, partial [Pedomonas sp.]|nr:penicillin-binding protein 2 [Pedomonas sp.]
DVRVQHALEYELNAAMEKFSAIGAAGIVLDVQTGELLAMTSLPAFDPNAVSRSPSETWFNRATQGVYEQGSTFKIFSTAMALEEGTVTLGTTYDISEPLAVGRFRIRDYRLNFKELTVAGIFMHSSNIGTALMALDMGTETQQAYMRKLGLLEPAQIELKESGAPLLPNPWSKVSTMTISYGHGIAVTSLHMATGVASVVNGGMWRPATLMKIPPGTERSTGERIFSEKTSQAMRELMRLVVVNGTGRQADAPGYRIGGKTGTAEKPGVGGYQRKSLITTFAGAFPMDDPKYVVMATLDEPKGIKETHGFATAGWNAAPVTRAVVQRVGPILGVEPNVNRDVDLSQMQRYIAEKQT